VLGYHQCIILEMGNNTNEKEEEEETGRQADAVAELTAE
jgi:hypothetical protein